MDNLTSAFKYFLEIKANRTDLAHYLFKHSGILIIKEDLYNVRLEFIDPHHVITKTEKEIERYLKKFKQDLKENYEEYRYFIHP